MEVTGSVADPFGLKRAQMLCGPDKQPTGLSGCVILTKFIRGVATPSCILFRASEISARLGLVARKSPQARNIAASPTHSRLCTRAALVSVATLRRQAQLALHSLQKLLQHGGPPCLSAARMLQSNHARDRSTSAHAGGHPLRACLCCIRESHAGSRGHVSSFPLCLAVQAGCRPKSSCQTLPLAKGWVS